MVTQQQIDADGYASKEVIEVDPLGGGVDTIYCVDILSTISAQYTKRLIQWKSSDGIADVIPGEGMNSGVHFIGIPRANDERIAFVECTETGDYSLVIPSFSDVSDEVVVRRVWCAALRPTVSNFTFVNPIKDIAVTASPLTVNVQTEALNEIKTIKSTDTVTITHTQSFPCVFGICYKHKIKGEVAEASPSPQPTTEEKKVTVHFHAPELLNSFEKSIVFSNQSGQYFKITDMALRNCSETNAGYIVNLAIDAIPERSYIIRPSDSLMILDSGFLHQKFIERKPDGLRCGKDIYVILTTTEANEGFDLELKYIQL